MTEQEWFTSNDPRTMLQWLDIAVLWEQRGHFVAADIEARILQIPRPKPPKRITTDRKLRLWACACCRAVWDGVACPRCKGRRSIRRRTADDVGFGRATVVLDCPDCHGSGRVGGLTDPRSRAAVETAERYADGLATKDELLTAGQEAGNARRESGVTAWDAAPNQRKDMLLLAAANCCQPQAAGAASEVSRLIQQEIPPAAQAALLRDIFGNPFRGRYERTAERQSGNIPSVLGASVVGELSPPTNQGFDPGHSGVVEPPVKTSGSLTTWLSWNDGAVVKLARTIYDKRRFGDMPLLADALEEAGCDDADILNHCRGKQSILKSRRCGGRQYYLPYETGYWKCEVCKRRSLAPNTDGGGCPKDRDVEYLIDVGPHTRGCWVTDLLLGKE